MKKKKLKTNPISYAWSTGVIYISICVLTFSLNIFNLYILYYIAKIYTSKYNALDIWSCNPQEVGGYTKP